MTRNIADFAPVDATQSPKFSQIGTFMRARWLPLEQVGDVDVAIVGVPFDIGTLYRTGTRQGPNAIRDMSRSLRFLNRHTLVAPFETARIADVGDVNVNPLDLEDSLTTIANAFRDMAEKGVRPLSFGGDHTIPLPILRGLVSSGPVGLVHYDAHSDTSDQWRGVKVNHATTFRRAVEEGLIDPKRTIQIGLRSQMNTKDDLKWARDSGMTLVTMDDFEDRGRAAVIEETRRVVGDGPAYISFDIDGLDSIYCPGTGVPEPGGFSMRDAQLMLSGLRGIDIIGADICEVSPNLDVGNITSLHAAHLGFELLCLLAESASHHAD